MIKLPANLWFLLLFIGGFTQANTQALPPQLEPWQQWVLHDSPSATCPFIYNAPERACLWPSNLSLALSKTGGRFTLRVDAFAKQWLTLPGTNGIWPKQVKIANLFIPVVNKNGVPAVLLEPGVHVIEGLYSWPNLPRTLPLPKNVGLVSVTINGNRVRAPNLDKQGTLWLGQKQTAIKKAVARDTLTAKVFRRLNDNTPQTIDTLLQLNVSGSEREVALGPILLPQTTAISFDSPLPARVESNGALRIQIKPGRFNIRLSARLNQPTHQFSFEPHNRLWPQQELWAFSENRNQRTVKVEGAATIDPSQTQIPSAWQNLPAYLLTPSAKLTLQELHRGDPKPASNQLHLQKTLWLDFSGKGYTVRDTISGTMHRQWRLEVMPPYSLGRADMDGKPQLITQLTGSSAEGIEVRSRKLTLEAVSRVAKPGNLPVSGWQQTFDSVKTTLALPPGWSAFYLGGADTVRGAWLSAWNLWDIFLVLVIAVSLAKVTSLPLGLLALATLIMVYQKDQSPVVGWLNIAAGLALLPYVSGRFGKWLCSYVAISFIGLTLLILPFVVQQARLVFYPQLEQSFSKSSSRNRSYDHTAELTAQADASSIDRVATLSAPKRSASKRGGASADSLKDYQEPSFQAAYDPAQKIQVGPGVPTWQWKTVYANWSGPVKAHETSRFILVSPPLNRFGHGLSIVLVTALLILLIKRFMQFNPWLRFKHGQNGDHKKTTGDKNSNLKAAVGGAQVLLLVVAGAVMMPTQKVHADVVIDNKLLTELKQRLLAPPKCQPHCAALESISLSLENDTLVINYWLNSQANLALPLPGTRGQWWPESVSVNNKKPLKLHTRNNRLMLYLTPGRHRLELSSPVTHLESFNLDFGFPLQNLSIHAPGWKVSGRPSAKNSSQNLQFARAIKATKQTEQNRLLPEPIAAFVQLSRTIEFGLEWSLLTRVTRVAPNQGPINLSIPLLPGEAPTSGEVKTPGFMDVRLGANQRSSQWRSSLAISDTLLLQAGKSHQWSETWTVKTTPIWHTRFEGIPAIAQSGKNVWPTWQPRPEERLSIHIGRPKPVPGAHLAIDDLSLTHTPAARASDTRLEIRLRATYGSQLDLPLPAQSNVKQVRINNIETPVSQVDQVLKIPVVPGEQRVQIEWQTPVGVQLKTQTPSIALGHPATNISLSMRMPRDRWTIALGGPALGPAVLFWGVLMVVIALAIALGKSQLTPLKPYEWVLLSLGVATFNLVVLVLIAAWFVSLSLRGKRQSLASRRVFNTTQVLLFLFSGVALCALISSVPSSLLSSPEMYVTGNSSSAHRLNWYQDQSENILPSAWVFSLPILAYKVIMLLWSLWLAFALMRWIRWAWTQLGTGGYWHPKPEPELQPQAVATTNSTDANKD